MRHRIAAIATAAVLIGACGGYVTAEPAYRTATAPRWQDPALFAQRVRTRMDGIEQNVRQSVAQGIVAAQALPELNDQRSQVDRTLIIASMDGVITPAERDQIRGQVRTMAAVPQRWQVAGAPAWGGGPQSGPYAPSGSNTPYSYDDSWSNF